MVVNANTLYSILLGRSSINRLKAIASTPHLVMKLPSITEDIVTVHMDERIARECYLASLNVEPIRPLYMTSPRGKSPRRQGQSLERHSRYRHPEVSPNFITHRLFVYKETRPIAHKKNWERNDTRPLEKNRKIDESKFYSKRSLYHMVGQCGHGQKIEW